MSKTKALGERLSPYGTKVLAELRLWSKRKVLTQQIGRFAVLPVLLSLGDAYKGCQSTRHIITRSTCHTANSSPGHLVIICHM